MEGGWNNVQRQREERTDGWDIMKDLGESAGGVRVFERWRKNKRKIIREK